MHRLTRQVVVSSVANVRIAGSNFHSGGHVDFSYRSGNCSRFFSITRRINRPSIDRRFSSLLFLRRSQRGDATGDSWKLRRCSRRSRWINVVSLRGAGLPYSRVSVSFSLISMDYKPFVDAKSCNSDCEFYFKRVFSITLTSLRTLEFYYFNFALAFTFYLTWDRNDEIIRNNNNCFVFAWNAFLICRFRTEWALCFKLSSSNQSLTSGYWKLFLFQSTLVA